MGRPRRNKKPKPVQELSKRDMTSSVHDGRGASLHPEGKTAMDNSVPGSLCARLAERQNCSNNISCFKKIAGVLSDEEIREHNIIENDISENHNPTVYDLTVGECHYVYAGSTGTSAYKWKGVYIGT